METPSMPQQQVQQQPLMNPEPEAVSNSAWQKSGSVGPFFAVITVITVLAIISCIFGRVYLRKEAHPLENIKHSSCFGWFKRCRCCMGNDVEVGAKRVIACGGHCNGKSRVAEPTSSPPPA